MKSTVSQRAQAAAETCMKVSRDVRAYAAIIEAAIRREREIVRRRTEIAPSPKPHLDYETE